MEAAIANKYVQEFIDETSINNFKNLRKKLIQLKSKI